MKATRSLKVKSVLAILLVTLGLLAQSAAWQTNVLAAPIGPPASAARSSQLAAADHLATTVRIEHTWHFMQNGQDMRVIAYNLGTVIGAQTILTHNHFDARIGTLDREWMTVTQGNDTVAELALSDVELNPMDGGTMLFGLPSAMNVPEAAIADQNTLKRLTVGKWLTVVYWDDVNQQIARQNFKITKLGKGTATLADPQHIINSGDSGGGVYLDGELVGNTWRITTDKQGRPMGIFTIALVPPQALS
jgi:hypothetical protein